MTSRFPKADRKLQTRLPTRLVVGALAAMGMVVWAGCGQGDESRYYCDDEGCYTCDAYGCSNVTPPPRTECSGQASCPPDQVCTATGCAVRCTDDSACPRGEVCKSNICTPPSGPPPEPKECTSKPDCGPGKACVDGKCQACGGTLGPCPCQKKADCDGDLQCVAGSCTEPKHLCKYSSECGPNRVCVDGQCLGTCDNVQCETGYTCDRGVCKPNARPPCTSDEQCGGETPKCLRGTCVKTCAEDPECGEGKYCNQGICVVDTRPKPNCETDSQCTGGGAEQRCRGGFCKYVCSDDQHCRSIDSRIGYCAKDGVCRNQTEAQASCTAPSDCDGKSCVDNQCK